MELPEPLQNYFKMNSNTHLRNNNNFKIPLYKTKLGQRSMDYCATKEWNKLPNNLKAIQNKYKFKAELKKYYIYRKT